MENELAACNACYKRPVFTDLAGLSAPRLRVSLGSFLQLPQLRLRGSRLLSRGDLILADQANAFC